MIETVATDRGPKAIGPYSQASALMGLSFFPAKSRSIRRLSKLWKEMLQCRPNASLKI